MSLQVCYILSSDGESDAYAGMTFVSASLVRRLHPAARVVLLLDEVAAAALGRKSARVLTIADEVRTVQTGLADQRLRSRFVKTRMRSEIDGDFVFLDADAIPVRPFDRMFRGREPLALVLDRNAKERQPGFPEWVGRVYGELGWRTPLPHYFNSGVMFWRDTPETRRLGEEWHRRWRAFCDHRGGSDHRDQPALNSAIDALGVPVRIMPPAYNAMIEASPALARGARIFHFYTSASGGLPQPDTLLRHLLDCLSQTGEIDWPAVRRAAWFRDPWMAPTTSIRRQVATRHYLRAARLAVRRATEKLGWARQAVRPQAVHTPAAPAAGSAGMGGER